MIHPMKRQSRRSTWLAATGGPLLVSPRRSQAADPGKTNTNNTDNLDTKIDMKKATLILAAALAIFTTAPAAAQNGVWTNDVDGVWSDPANWLNGVVADGSGNTATFSNSFAAVSVSLDTPVTIGNIRFVQGSITVSNNGVDANVLTLAGPSKPVIFVDPGVAAATLRRVVLAGSDGFILDGGATLNLFKENADLDNTITGGIVLNNSTIQVQGINVDDLNLANTRALGSITSFTFHGGTLNLRPTANSPVSYGNVNGNLIVPEGQTGTLVLPLRFSGTAGDNSTTIGSGLGGNLTGAGTLNVNTVFVRAAIVGDWSAFTGQINVIREGGPGADDKQFRMGNFTGLPNAALHLGGVTDYGFFFYRQLTSNTVFSIGQFSGDNPLVQLRGSATPGTVLLFDIGARQTNPADSFTFAGSIVDAAGPAGLIKRSAGRLVLSGNNTYTGPTTISSGVLQIGDGSSDSGAIGSGPITNFGALIFARPSGTIDVAAPIAGPGAITNTGWGGLLILRGANTYTAPTVSTAGRLHVGTASRATGPYILQDVAEGFGAIMSSAGATLTMSSLSFAAPSTFDFNLGAFPNPTAAVVTNTGNIALNGNVTVNVSGSGLTVGSITLLRYGSRSGPGSFVLGSLPAHVTAYTFHDDTANNRVLLTITATLDRTLRWVGGPGAVWDVNNPANRVWREVGSGLLTNYYDGADVLFDDTATGGATVDVSAWVSPASVIVNNTALNYRFVGGGSISGAATLTKRGAGALTLANNNNITGATLIEAGMLEIGDGVLDGALGTGAVTNSGIIRVNRATLGTIPNAIHGSGRVVVAGPGQADMTGASTYTGGIALMPGTTLGNGHATAAGIGGGMRIEMATVVLGANINPEIGAIAVITNATFRNTATRRIDAPIRGTNVIVTFDKTALLTLHGDISGISGVITNMGAGLLRFNAGGANTATGSASVLWVLADPAGWLQPRNGSVNHLGAVTGAGVISAQQSGSGLVTWTVGALNTSEVFQGVINDGASFGQPARFTALVKVGSGTWTLDNAGGANSLLHRSSTVVSNGVLALAGATSPDASTNITVAAPGVLDVSGRTDGTLTLGATTTIQSLWGDGAIRGSVTLGGNARLEPGFPIGALTVTNALTLGGVTTLQLNRTNSLTSDRVVAQSFAGGGATLNVANLGPALVTGDTFQLFNRPVTAFSVVNLPVADGTVTYEWDNRLAIDGSIRVLRGAAPPVDTTPTNLAAAFAPGQVTLSWPASHTGWRLLSQTNTLAVGLGANWVEVAGSSATNRVTLSVNPTNPAVFFRLVHP